MHSQKIIKVLGAGLTAAALTLGAAAPALAVINVNTSSAAFTNDFVDVKFGKPEKVRFKIGVTYDSEDRVFYQRVFFSTEGPDYRQELNVKSTDNDPVTTSFIFANAKDWKGGTDTLGNYLFNGFWSADTIKQYGTSDSEVLKTTHLSGVDIEVREAAEAEQQIGIDNDAINNDSQNGGNAFDSISAGQPYVYINYWGVGNSDKPEVNENAILDDSSLYTVEFDIRTPTGKVYTVTAAPNDASKRFEALAFNDEVPVSGTYKLVEVRIGTKAYFNGNGNYIGSTAADATYELTTWSILSLGSNPRTNSNNNTGAEFKLDQPYIPMYRMYNPHSGEHFFTAKVGERDLLVEEGWNYEGIGFYAPDFGSYLSNLKAVYRLYNGIDHHYATEAEAKLLEDQGWKNEGLAFYSNETVDPTRRDQFFLNGQVVSGPETQVAMYRLCNRNATVGMHHYTSSKGERDLLISAGWRNEGVGFYGYNAEWFQRVFA